MAGTEFVIVADRLVERLGGVSPTWFGARAGAGQTRAAALRSLVVVLAELGRQAGTGAPRGVQPSELGVHALADQVRVLVDDLVDAPALTPTLAARAGADIRACYDALWV